MRAAADLEDGSEKHVAMENRLYPMRELLGDMLMEQGQPGSGAEGVRSIDEGHADAAARVSDGARQGGRGGGREEKRPRISASLRDSRRTAVTATAPKCAKHGSTSRANSVESKTLPADAMAGSRVFPGFTQRCNLQD